MIREWIKEKGEYPFKVYDKEGKEINIPITERLTEQLETLEKVVQLQVYLELAYGMTLEINYNDIDTTLENLQHLERILKNENI